MSERMPAVDVFIGRDHDAWRLYVAPGSWCPPMIRDRLDKQLEAFPVAEPDLDDLDRHMWKLDAPYEKRVSTMGGVQIMANGRSAVSLAVWLERLLGLR